MGKNDDHIIKTCRHRRRHSRRLHSSVINVNDTGEYDITGVKVNEK